MSFIIFFGMLAIVIFSCVFYAGMRLTSPLDRHSPLRYAVWGLLIVWSALLFIIPTSTRIFGAKNFDLQHPDLMKFLNLVAYGFMGFLAILIFSLVAVDLIRLLMGWIYFLMQKFSPDHAEILNPARREFLFNFAPWGILGATTILTTVGYKHAMGDPQVKKVAIPKEGLPTDLHGFKIAQISDLHVGTTIRKDFVEKVVEKTMAQKPDLICVTGDLIDGHVDQLSPELEPLRKLQAKHGIFYVTGNHEYYWGVDAWIQKVTELGFKNLHNSHHILNHGSSKLMVAGIPDIHAERFNPKDAANARAAVEHAPSCDFNLFLAHQPGSYKLAEQIPCDLQLSGHTHAGQFYPIGFLIRFFHKYYKGLNRHEDKFWVYVNQGTGYWGPPNRLGIPSEITLLELTKA